MRTAKLTLSVDKDLIRKAKRRAGAEGTSLSSMISRIFEAMLRTRDRKDRPGPLTGKATGLVRLPAGRSDRDLLEDALSEKYGP